MNTAMLRLVAVLCVLYHSFPLLLRPSSFIYVARIIRAILFIRISSRINIGHYKAVHRYYTETNKGVVLFNRKATAGWSMSRMAQAFIHECIHNAQRYGGFEIPFTDITDYIKPYLSEAALADVRQGLARYAPKDLEAEYDAWVGMHFFTRKLEVI